MRAAMGGFDFPLWPNASAIVALSINMADMSIEEHFGALLFLRQLATAD